MPKSVIVSVLTRIKSAINELLLNTLKTYTQGQLSCVAIRKQKCVQRVQIRTNYDIYLQKIPFEKITKKLHDKAKSGRCSVATKIFLINVQKKFAKISIFLNFTDRYKKFQILKDFPYFLENFTRQCLQENCIVTKFPKDFLIDKKFSQFFSKFFIF